MPLCHCRSCAINTSGFTWLEITCRYLWKVRGVLQGVNLQDTACFPLLLCQKFPVVCSWHTANRLLHSACSQPGQSFAENKWAWQKPNWQPTEAGPNPLEDDGYIACDSDQLDEVQGGLCCPMRACNSKPAFSAQPSNWSSCAGQHGTEAPCASWVAQVAPAPRYLTCSRFKTRTCKYKKLHFGILSFPSQSYQLTQP